MAESYTELQRFRESGPGNTDKETDASLRSRGGVIKVEASLCQTTEPVPDHSATLSNTDRLNGASTKLSRHAGVHGVQKDTEAEDTKKEDGREYEGSHVRLTENEDTCSLPVKFEVTSEMEDLGSRNDLEQAKNKMMSQQSARATRRTTRKPQFTQRIWHLDIVDTVFQRWRRIGASVGLCSDTEIASFLMQHYENTKSGFQSPSHCSSCHTPLALTCVTCNPVHPHTCLPAQCSNAASQAEDDDGNVNNSFDPTEECSVDKDDARGGQKSDTDFQVLKKQTPRKQRKQKRKSTSSSPPPSSSLPAPAPPSLPSPPLKRSKQQPARRPATRSCHSLNKKSTPAALPASPEDSAQAIRSTVCLQTPKEKKTSVKKPLTLKRAMTLKRHLHPKRPQKPPANMQSADADVQRTKPRMRHVCSECGATFSRKGGLKVHLRIHTGEKPYTCDECDLAFNQTVSLIVHKRKHSGERPYVCTECGSSFPLASTLKQHSRIHSGERPFSCEQCHKTFSRSGDLTSHMRVHTGVRPFLCQDCGKRFAASSDLTKHKRTHTGDRPFECPECHKKFPFPHRLTSHMRSHTGDKPYLCTVCGAAFARASNLTVHFRIHTGDKPFECEECGKRFSDSGNLCKHRRTSHGGLGRKVDKMTTSEISVSEGVSLGVGLSASLSSISTSLGIAAEDSVPLGVELSTTPVPNQEILSQTVSPSSLPLFARNPSSLATQAVGCHDRNSDFMNSESNTSLTQQRQQRTQQRQQLTQQRQQTKVSSSHASTVQTSLNELASSFQNGASVGRNSILSPLFDGGGNFGEDDKSIPGLVDEMSSQLSRVLKCEECQASFADHGQLAKHCQALHGGVDKACVAMGTSTQRDQSSYQEMNNSVEKEQASLLPYFSSAALGYYYQQ